MYTTLIVLHWIAAMVLLIEAINRIESCKFLRSGLCASARVAGFAKGMAYCLVALAAGGALISPVLRALEFPVGIWVNPVPSVSECMAYIAWSIIIVRRWIVCLVKELRAAKVSDAICKQVAKMPMPTSGASSDFPSHHGHGVQP